MECEGDMLRLVNVILCDQRSLNIVMVKYVWDQLGINSVLFFNNKILYFTEKVFFDSLCLYFPAV